MQNTSGAPAYGKATSYCISPHALLTDRFTNDIDSSSRARSCAVLLGLQTLCACVRAAHHHRSSASPAPAFACRPPAPRAVQLSKRAKWCLACLSHTLLSALPLFSLPSSSSSSPSSLLLSSLRAPSRAANCITTASEETVVRRSRSPAVRPASHSSSPLSTGFEDSIHSFLIISIAHARLCHHRSEEDLIGPPTYIPCTRFTSNHHHGAAQCYAP